MAPAAKAEPWYRDGLRFECTRCGRCCGGAPGFVWVTEQEITALARRFGVSEADFRRRYTRRVDGYGTALTETDDFDCVFLDHADGLCTVYEDRPRQCRTYPFWDKVLASPATWEIEAKHCPGIDEGRRWPLVRIRPLAADDGIPGDR